MNSNNFENKYTYNKNGKSEVFSSFFKKSFNCKGNLNIFLKEKTDVNKEFLMINQTPKQSLNKLKFSSIGIKPDAFQSPKIVKGMHTVIKNQLGSEKPNNQIRKVKQMPHNTSQLYNAFRIKRNVSTNLLLDNIQLVKSTSKKDIREQRQEFFLKALNSFNARKFNIYSNCKSPKENNFMRLSGNNFYKENDFQRKSCVFDLVESIQ